MTERPIEVQVGPEARKYWVPVGRNVYALTWKYTALKRLLRLKKEASRHAILSHHVAFSHKILDGKDKCSVSCCLIRMG